MRKFVIALLLASASAVRAGGGPCVGDCDGGGDVSVDELIVGVNIALGLASVASCLSFDADDSGAVEVDEIIQAVNNALTGCAAGPSATPAATPTPMPGGPLALAGITSRSVSALLQAPKLLGAAALVNQLVPTEGEANCPQGGTVMKTAVAGGFSFRLFSCRVPTNVGWLGISGNGSFASNFLTASLTLDYRTPEGAMVLAAGVNMGGTVSGTAGGSCLVTALSAPFRGSAGTSANGRSTTTAVNQTTIALDSIAFDGNCMPVSYRMTVTGSGTLYPSDVSIDVSFDALRLDVDGTVEPAQLSVSGGVSSPCIGSPADLQTSNALKVPTHSLCPTEGTLQGLGAQIRYEASQMVDLDVDGNGSFEIDDVEHCFDPFLLICAP